LFFFLIKERKFSAAPEIALLTFDAKKFHHEETPLRTPSFFQLNHFLFLLQKK